MKVSSELASGLALDVVVSPYQREAGGWLYGQDRWCSAVAERSERHAVVTLAHPQLVRPAMAGVQHARRLAAPVCAERESALGFYLASPSIGLSSSTTDIGNWGQTLGIANMATEVAAIAVAAWALRHRHGDQP